MNKLVKYIIESRFNFNIDQLEDIDNEEEFSLSKQQYKSKSMKQEYLENSGFVDLDLPSGTLWAKYNFGVDPNNLKRSNNWYGKYYAWGETQTKAEYTDVNYDPSLLSVYMLDASRDIVTLTMGSNYKIPSLNDAKELIEYTDQELVDGYNGINTLKGIILSSKKDKTKQIFFPYAGERCHISNLNPGVFGRGFEFNYWIDEKDKEMDRPYTLEGKWYRTQALHSWDEPEFIYISSDFYGFLGAPIRAIAKVEK